MSGQGVLERSGRPPTRTLHYGDHPDQLIDLHGPGTEPESSPRPLVVLVHGGYWKPEWDRGHMSSMADALVDAGCPVAVIEYRRLPGDPDATLDDAVAAVGTSLTALGRDRDVVLVGFSAGGHLALWLAAHETTGPTLVRVVALAPVADLAEAERRALGDDAVRRFLGTSAAMRRDVDPLHIPPRTQVRIVHGTQDTTVPIAVAETYASVHGLEIIRVVADHEPLIDPGSAAWPTVAAAILHR